MAPFVLLCVLFLLLHLPLVRRWPGGPAPSDKAAGALAGVLAMTGTLHFTSTERFVAMIPPALPSPEGLVLASGAAELLFALLLLVPPARRFAGLAAALLFLAVWPANAYAAWTGESPFAESRLYLWLRVPFQLLYVGWAAWVALGHLPFATFRRRMFAKWYDKVQAPYETYSTGRRRRLLADARGTVVELGPGTGANLPHVPPNARWIGIEPNPYMRDRLRARADELGLELGLRDLDGERLPFADESVDCVVSTLVLCSVPDPAAVVADIRRILVPGGRFLFMEHVAAPAGSGLRLAQDLLEPFWQVFGDGCCPNRDLAGVIREAGFGELELEEYRVPRGSAVPVIAPHVMGRATK